MDFDHEVLGTFVKILSKADEKRLPHQSAFRPNFIKKGISSERSPYTKHHDLLDYDALYPLVDYMGCDSLIKAIEREVLLQVLERPVYYLEWASDTGCMVAARAAIKAGAMDNLQKNGTDWWTAIANLQSSWQIELSRLRWEQGRQLVNRPDDWTNLGANGRRLPRRQEIMLRDRRLTRAQMAERFEPIPCASMLHSLVWTDGSQDTPWLELFVGARESQINEVTIKGNGVETEVHEEGACSRLPHFERAGSWPKSSTAISEYRQRTERRTPARFEKGNRRRGGRGNRRPGSHGPSPYGSRHQLVRSAVEECLASSIPNFM